MVGYHIKNIEKGVLGEASKILEETMEFMDACDQNANIMSILELSDLYGAIEQYLQNHHPSITMIDLAKMSSITERAFKNGQRNPKN